MTLNLEPGTAEACIAACGSFLTEVRSLARGERYSDFGSAGGSFPTACQLGSVYSLFASEDLQKLLNGHAHQAEAMSMLFAVAGGLIDSQDEAVAAALGKASASVDGLQSLGLLQPAVVAMVNPEVGLMLQATDADVAVGDYQRVGHEEVADAPLDWMVSGAQALSPAEFGTIGTMATEVGEKLRGAGDALHAALTDQLSGPWQGDFAAQGMASLTPFVQSVTDLADTLDEVGRRATGVENGFIATQRQMADTAANYEAARASATARDSGELTELLAPPTDSAHEVARSKAAAEEQARAIINGEYSPAVMDANLSDLDIPLPYRIVSGTALGGGKNLDLAGVWNVDGVIHPATPGTPDATALAAVAGGGAAAEMGTAGGGGTANGAAIEATTTSPPTAATDAATQQALLASRAGGADGAGAIAATTGQAGAGVGVNASTTAAGAPFAPMTAAGGQQSGPGSGGIRGIRGAGNANRNRERSNERGFGSAAGLVGGSGAAAAGAAASRLGGAGTLAGIGGGGGAGVSGGAGAAGSGAGAGAFGAGSAKAVAAGSGVGAVSSSSSGAAQAGRAGGVPMGGMAGAAGAGQNSDRRGHTPAGYLTNATNTTAIIGDPLKVTPAVLGRKPVEDLAAAEEKPEPSRLRVIGRDYTGRGAR